MENNKIKSARELRHSIQKNQLILCLVLLSCLFFSPPIFAFQPNVQIMVNAQTKIDKTDIQLIDGQHLAGDEVFDIVYEMQLHLMWSEYDQWATDLNWEKLREFYAKREFLPVWLDFDGPTAKAKLVRDMLVFSDREGLDPAEYHAPAIQYMWRARRAKTRARLELMLTDAFLRYGVEVSVGYQFPQAADFDWHVKPNKIHLLNRLESLLTAPDMLQFIDKLPPPHEGYARLKGSLAHYRLLAQKGDWPRIKSGPQLAVEVDHPQVAELRKRLQHEGFISPESDVTNTFFDEELDAAVRQFQNNYGHKVDGIVGRSSRRSLNVSLLKRIDIIKQNMERWRWIPRDLGERYVMVNMAGYNLEYVENGQSVLNMPVIVGKPYRATPAFVDKLEYLEFNPTWSVPPRIAKEKFLPKLRENADFLKTNRLKVLDSWRRNAREVDPETIDWSKVSDKWFPYKLEQVPGEHNSMGRVKFMFPNRFRVYLHDTPNRKLFKRYVRTFSAGCIRLSRPFDLASKILGEDPIPGYKNFSEIIASGETTRVPVGKSVPVYLLYWTSWVDEDGVINFRRDIYQRDEKIATSREVNLS